MTNDSRLTFSEAAEAWLESRRQYLHPNTMRAYRVDLKPLMPLIGGISIDQIGIEHIRTYQRTRGLKVIPQSVNRELGTFQQVMKEYDQWARLATRYRTLRIIPRRAGHSLTPKRSSACMTWPSRKRNGSWPRTAWSS